MAFNNCQYISQNIFHKKNHDENHFPVNKVYSEMSYKRLFKSHQSGNTDDPETTNPRFNRSQIHPN